MKQNGSSSRYERGRVDDENNQSGIKFAIIRVEKTILLRQPGLVYATGARLFVISLDRAHHSKHTHTHTRYGRVFSPAPVCRFDKDICMMYVYLYLDYRGLNTYAHCAEKWEMHRLIIAHIQMARHVLSRDEREALTSALFLVQYVYVFVDKSKAAFFYSLKFFSRLCIFVKFSNCRHHVRIVMQFVVL